MGHMRHHAIMVTSFDRMRLEWAAAKAVEMGCTVIGPLDIKINNISTFLVCPDGSKEGWSQSNVGDRQRKDFITYLNSLRHSDGSNNLEWAEVAYGSDDREAVVENHAWTKKNCTPP